MSDLRELYQEVIFDHNRKPRNFHGMADANHAAEGYNPLCGDKVKVFLKVEGNIIKDVSFEGTGCAISTASASLMTESLKGKRKDEALKILGDFQSMVTGHTPEHEIGKLKALAGVQEFPQRVKCATLPWHTLLAALNNLKEPATTE